jgi:hypothetical protein
VSRSIETPALAHAFQFRILSAIVWIGGRAMKRFLLTFAVFSTFTSGAWGYCSEPTAPSCVDGYGKFNEEYEFQRCRNDVESFRSDTEEYLSCLRRKGEEARTNFSNAVDSFNRRARSSY